MEEKTFNKLVRDNIIDKITDNGELASYHVLDENEYKKELLRKLREECEEVIDAFDYGYSADMVVELGDVLEVIRALADSINVRMEEVNDVSLMKRDINGSFEKRIFLEKTTKIK